MIAVILPRALLAVYPGVPARVELEAASVAGALDALDARWPGMAGKLRDSRPAIRRHITVFADGERATLETTLRPGAEMLVVTAISGG